jgi:hypothetical protein
MVGLCLYKTVSLKTKELALQHFLPHVGYSSFLTDDISKLFNVY